MFDKIFLFHKPLEEILCQTHPEKMDGILQLRGLYPTKKAFPFPTFSRMVLLSQGKRIERWGYFFEQYHAKFRLISLPALGQYARGIRNCYHHIATERAKHAVVTDGFSLRQYLFCHPLAEQRTFPCTVCSGLAHLFPKQIGQKQRLLH